MRRSRPRGLAPLIAFSLLGALVVVALLSSGDASSQGTASSIAPRTAAASPRGTVELPGLRTASSATFERADGARIAHVYPAPIHFRDGGGVLRPIDNRLAATPSGFHNRANGYDLELPRRLADGPVRVRDADAWLSFRLRDAAEAAGSVDGARARYADVFDGVDVGYVAQADGVKESLVLQDAAAPSTYRFALDFSAGLTVREGAGGGIEFVDDRGRVRLALAPPFMRELTRDGHGAVSDAVDLELRRTSSGGHELVLSADERWLADPARRFPVEIDPTVAVNPAENCFIDSATPDQTFCTGWPKMEVGRGHSANHRALVYFNLQGAVPAGSVVLDATMSLWLYEREGSGAVPIRLHRATRAWNAGATWNKATTSQAWSTPGGDFASVNSTHPGHAGTLPAWVDLKPTRELVQGWVDGTTANHGVLLKTAELADGEIMTFRTNRHTDATTWPRLTVVYEPLVADTAAPLIQGLEHVGLAPFKRDDEPLSTTVRATDEGTGVKSFSVTYPDGTTDTRVRGCLGTASTRCALSDSERFDYRTNTQRFPQEGKSTLRARVRDAAGKQSAAATWAVGVDRGAPAVELSGSLWEARGSILFDDDYELQIDAEDGSLAQPQDERSGVKSIEVLVKREAPGATFVREDYVEQTCAAGSCALSRSFGFHTDDFEQGEHTVRVVSRDQLGHERVREFKVFVGQALGAGPRVQSRLGLEEFWQYDSTETGAGSAAHVNLATGNLVWHHVPVVNAGRGLSTIVNLTYNSQESERDATLIEGPAGDALGQYAQAGRGFSLSVSGLTRLNEPLDLTQEALGKVALTDADGTRHVFQTPSSGPDAGEVYAPPAGVQLHLRRFSKPTGIVDPLTGFGELEQPDKAWAATRPDGVTFFFDQHGYQTSIRDRNGNTMRFVYEFRSPGGGVCQQAAGLQPPEIFAIDDAVCPRRVTRVDDPAGRPLSLSYHPDISLEPGVVGSGPIKQITDHAGRVYEFGYDPDGYLVSFTEAKGAVNPHGGSDEHTWEFEYEPAGALSLFKRRALTAVDDLRGSLTTFTHKSDGPAGGPGEIGDGIVSRKRVETLTDRPDQGVRVSRRFTYEHTTVGGQEVDKATVRDGRSFDWRYTMDAQGRPIELLDPRSTKTELGWDTDNNLATLKRAAGSTDESTSLRTYNANGLLLTRTDALGHTTRLTYFDSPGAPENKTPREGSGGTSLDAGRGFVSDLATLTTPKGSATPDPADFTTKLSYNTLAAPEDPEHRGNLRFATDPEDGVAEARYDAQGQLTREFDEVGNPPTIYQDHDPNGLPRTVIDPRGKVWRFTYDAVGNTTSAADPRAGGPPCGANQRFTTELRYDAYDRVTHEIAPKDSAACRFITRTWQYDGNGNVRFYTDGNGAVYEGQYTVMDRIGQWKTPVTGHVDGTAKEITLYSWDAEENMVAVHSPKGTATATADDFSTRYVYDALGRVTEEVQRSRGSEVKDLTTSYAYDRRDNPVGLVDPRQNALGGNPTTNALDPAKRRFTFEYDRADRLTAEVERPAAEAFRTVYRHDANDNPIALTDPRGGPPAEGASFADCLGALFTSCLRYDERDLLVEESDGEDRRTLVERRGDGRVTAVTRPKGTASTAVGDYRTAFAYHETGELKERTIPHAQNQYGSNALKVTYGINDVGDPTTITDASGEQIVNTFLDSGELASTTRPSWWTFDGNGLRERSAQEMGGMPEEANLPDSEGHGDLGSVAGQPAPELLPRAGTTRFGYDAELRLTTVTDTADEVVRLDRDPVGRVVELRRPIDAVNPPDPEPERFYTENYGYDLNGNLRRTGDGEGHRTNFAVDQFDRVVAEARPGSTQPGPDTTTFTLDENGNTTGIETPRGTDWAMTYDALDRLRSRTDPEGGTTSWDYDQVGNQTRMTLPRGNALPAGTPEAVRDEYRTRREYNAANELRKRIDGRGHEWRYEYDLNGNRTLVDAPPVAHSPDAAEQRQVTTRTFDGRDLLWTETTGMTGNGGDRKRTRVFEFDPNGQLRRIVNPKGVSSTTGLPTFTYSDDALVSSSPGAARNATVYEYEEAADPTLLTSVRLPWGEVDAEDERRYRQRFGHDARGRVNTIDPPFDGPTAPLDARTTYDHFETGWIKSADDNWQRFEYGYDLRGLQTSWKVIEKASNRTREITRAYLPSGALASRTGQKNLGSGVQPEYTYAYQYDRNGLLTLLHDQRLHRKTSFTYDDADRLIDANEAAFTTPAEDEEDVVRRGKDTRLAYDLDGNVTTRQTDGRIQADGGYAGGKTATFDFDPLGREQLMTVVAEGETTRRTFSDYWPGGELRSRRTERSPNSNDTVERWFRFSDGRLSRLDRKRQGASSFAKNQAYVYDVNGNRTQDERGTHLFNSRDQLVRWTKPAGAGQVDYVLNGSGAVTSRSDGTSTTTYHYLAGGERLSHAIVTQGQTSSRTDYSYAQGFGDITSYKAEGAAEPAAEHTYDAFGRMRRSKRGAAEELYTYDGLDRRDTKAAGGRTFDLSYVGLSESLSQEQQFGGGERRSYDYNSVMERLGTARRTSQTETAPYRAFSIDASGSVEGLENANGQIIGLRYGYDPYGAQLTAESGLHAEAQANPFRFQGHYYDPAQQAYDMRARAYLPELGRFLQEDHYEQAAGDFLLEADPLTQDRYAFLGGNPVNWIEFDGHKACTGTCRPGEYQQAPGGEVRQIPDRTPDRQAVHFTGSRSPVSPAEEAAAYRASQDETVNPKPARPEPDAAEPPRTMVPGIAPGHQVYTPPEADKGHFFIAGLESEGRCNDFLCAGFTAAVGDHPLEVLATAAGGGITGFAAKQLGKLCAKACPGAAERVVAAFRRFGEETGSVGGGGAASGGARTYLSLTSRNFRENLARRTGGIPEGAEAHHVFPRKFVQQFEGRRININIHDPKYGAWWERGAHRRVSHQYNREWEDFLRGSPTRDQVLEFGRRQSRRYGLEPGL